MIHISKINLITEKEGPDGKPVPFAFKAITLKGEVIEGKNCVVTSSNYKQNTRNIKWLASGEIRKIKNISFIELNGVEVSM